MKNMHVTVNMTHQKIDRMIINLKAPNGQILNLFNQHGAGSTGTAKDLNTVVSSTATAPFSSGTPPYSTAWFNPQG